LGSCRSIAMWTTLPSFYKMDSYDQCKNALIHYYRFLTGVVQDLQSEEFSSRIWRRGCRAHTQTSFETLQFTTPERVIMIVTWSSNTVLPLCDSKSCPVVARPRRFQQTSKGWSSHLAQCEGCVRPGRFYEPIKQNILSAAAHRLGSPLRRQPLCRCRKPSKNKGCWTKEKG
jgi:hypothetical protein